MRRFIRTDDAGVIELDTIFFDKVPANAGEGLIEITTPEDTAVINGTYDAATGTVTPPPPDDLD